jgi:hypothetical protein
MIGMAIVIWKDTCTVYVERKCTASHDASRQLPAQLLANPEVAFKKVRMANLCAVDI